jgi:hypothetical protein
VTAHIFVIIYVIRTVLASVISRFTEIIPLNLYAAYSRSYRHLNRKWNFNRPVPCFLNIRPTNLENVLEWETEFGNMYDQCINICVQEFV